VVFDPGHPNKARDLLAEIKARTPLPIRFVALSHHHPDHAAGAAVFAQLGAQLIAAESGRSSYEGWAREEFARKLESRPDEYKGLEYAAPTLYVDQSFSIEDATQVLELTHYGHAHTQGDLVGWLPGPGILLAGDVSNNGQHSLANASLAGWVDVLEQLKPLPVKTVVPGHGPRAGPELLDKSRRYVAVLLAQVKLMVAEGADFETVLDSVEIPFYESWTGVEVGDELGNVRRAFLEAGGKLPES